MSKDAKIDRLRSVHIFSKLSDADLRDVAEGTTEVAVKAGRVLARQGSTGAEAFVIESGEATITVDGAEVGVISAGEIVGEMGLLTGGPRAATITARTDMEVQVIEPGHFQALLDKPSITKALLLSVVERLRSADALLHHHH
ncbi:MAG: cyclic nucleotide-binding domain-containing protein [Acidimicrobiia bacterium]|nr:cyclic nucleotide-binding domain-containing protein [Acidimicrobiia bacterium]